eukprot:TRINITY_DN34722_c0_g1_i1.p1 TRINITY_DN34722_c0_g1~~TRINITY_DN34722_c0_g1_i1.p1  ORF type:complete len:974 (+),score=177.84 TRINITY_DN34722_c0_g1_i1:65-2923(+)
MALLRRVNELQRGTSSKNRLHIELLQAFADHGAAVSAPDVVTFLSHLRQTRDAVAVGAEKSAVGPRSVMQRWANECRQHEGFAVLRNHLISEEGIKGLSGPDLSRAYNQLRRMNLQHEAELVWPVVSSRLGEGKLQSARELLGLWSVVPEEHLDAMDAPLAKAMQGEQLKTWQLVGAVGRALHRPESQAVRLGVLALGKRLRDISSADLALLITQLSGRSAAAASSGGTAADVAIPADLAEVSRNAALELVQRDGDLATAELCGLLRAINRSDDVLWPKVRKQLLLKKDFSASQALTILRFVQSEDNVADSDSSLAGLAAKRLQKLLDTQAHSGLVALVSKSLDVILGHVATCRSLLNAAVKLRQDLFPAVLWGLFVRAGDVGLLNAHKSLHPRLQGIGQILEKHGVQRQRMPLRELLDAAKAMQRNKIVLHESLSQMAQQFVDVHNEVLKRLSNDEAPKDPEAANTNWLGEVQYLLVSFWVQHRLLGAEPKQALSRVAEEIVAPGGNCQIKGSQLVEVISDLQKIQDDEALQLLSSVNGHFVATFPQLSNDMLLEIADGVISADIQRSLIAEVRRRLVGTSTKKNPGNWVVNAVKGSHFDQHLSMLSRCVSWSQAATTAAAPQKEDEGCDDVTQHLADVVSLSLSGVLRKEPEDAVRRLTTTVTTFVPLSSLGSQAPLVSVPMRELRGGLQQQALTSTQKPGVVAELAFGFAAFYGGAMPLDIVLRLWRFAGSALASRNETGAVADNTSAEDGPYPLTPMRVAKLWAFCLAAKHLTTPSAVAAMRMTPEAHGLEEALTQLAIRPGKARFEFREPNQLASATVGALREALLELAPAEPREDMYLVPGTPYVAHVALEGPRLLVVVPRADHLVAIGDTLSLNGAGIMMQRTLEALGWRLLWTWPDRSEEGSTSVAVGSLRKALGIDAEAQVIDVSAEDGKNGTALVGGAALTP